MLTEICQELKNWFDVRRIFGEFTIAEGHITVDDLQESQYFRIIGSVFNDGVHQSTDALTDEVFDGAVWLLAIPQPIVDLNLEIENWVDKYGEQIVSPYNSESFEGYSYSKGGANWGSSSNSVPTWKSVFADKLNRWRKI